MSLPLRLWAEPLLTPLTRGRCFCLALPSTAATTAAATGRAPSDLALAVDDHGAVALICEASAKPRLSSAGDVRAACSLDDVPGLLLVRGGHAHAHAPQWFAWQHQSWKALPRAPGRVSRGVSSSGMSRALARVVVRGIHAYFSKQILEPSVRGFLSILEKQFTRGDLYLFELLQNAVDDGASVVSLRVLTPPATAGQQCCLRVCHDGRRFTPMDVLGLASVGLSTKQLTGKRTIGFMGIGFKSVYRRFSRVTVADGCWRFRFAKPMGRADDDPAAAAASKAGAGHGWVMLPRWMAQENDDRSFPPPSPSGRSEWCTFDLELPVGGAARVRRDLNWLPSSVPALLGRTALGNRKIAGRHDATTTDSAAESVWTLEWGRRCLRVAVVPESAPSSPSSSVRVIGDGRRRSAFGSSSSRSRSSSSSRRERDDSRTEEVTVTTSDADSQGDATAAAAAATAAAGASASASAAAKAKRWLFISCDTRPSRAAREAYAAHTKKTLPADAEMREEVSIFFALSRGGIPMQPAPPKGSSSSSSRNSSSGGSAANSAQGRGRGKLHAVLPTRLRVPCGQHVQGNFLLSVDRTTVQSLGSNAWNADLLAALPRLLASYVRWLARTATDRQRIAFGSEQAAASATRTTAQLGAAAAAQAFLRAGMALLPTSTLVCGARPPGAGGAVGAHAAASTSEEKAGGAKSNANGNGKTKKQRRGAKREKGGRRRGKSSSPAPGHNHVSSSNNQHASGLWLPLPGIGDGMSLDCAALARVCRTERVVPVLAVRTGRGTSRGPAPLQVTFVTGPEALRLPRAFLPRLLTPTQLALAAEAASTSPAASLQTTNGRGCAHDVGLPVEVLQAWFSAPPLALDALGDDVVRSPLFSSPSSSSSSSSVAGVRVLDAATLKASASRLASVLRRADDEKNENGTHEKEKGKKISASALLTIRLLACFGRALSLQDIDSTTSTSKRGKKGKKESVAAKSKAATSTPTQATTRGGVLQVLPDASSWCVFPTHEGESCVGPAQLRWPGPKYWELPSELQARLAPFVLHADGRERERERERDAQRTSTSAFSRDGRDRDRGRGRGHDHRRQQQQRGRRNNHSNGGRRHAQATQRQPRLHLLRSDVAKLLREGESNAEVESDLDAHGITSSMRQAAQAAVQAAQAVSVGLVAGKKKGKATAAPSSSGHSHAVVTVAELCRRFLAAQHRQWKGRYVATAAAAEIVALARWAAAHNLPAAIEYVLVASPSSGTSATAFVSSSDSGKTQVQVQVKLVPVADAVLGRVYAGTSSEVGCGEAVDALAPVGLSDVLVAPIYLTTTSTSTNNAPSTASSSPNPTPGQWHRFWRAAGVSAGIGFRATSSKTLSTADSNACVAAGHDRRGPKLRGTSKTVPLPYALGKLTRKHALVVDVELAPTWSRLLRRLSASSSSSSNSRHVSASAGSSESASNSSVVQHQCTALARLLLILCAGTAKARARAIGSARAGRRSGGSSSSGLDVAIAKVTRDTTPAAADAFAGKDFDAAAEEEEQVQHEAEASEGTVSSTASSSASVTSSTVGVQVPVPARRRLYYLPPGQAGASALDLGVAAWISTLRSTAWVPVPSSSSSGSSGSHGSVAAAAPMNARLVTPAQARLLDKPPPPPPQARQQRQRQQQHPHPQPQRAYLPVALFPRDVREALSASPLYALLAFATAPPPPPLSRLAALARAARSGTAGVARAYGSVSAVVAIWEAVLDAYDAGSISTQQAGRVQRLCARHAVLPGSGLSRMSHVTGIGGGGGSGSGGGGLALVASTRLLASTVPLEGEAASGALSAGASGSGSGSPKAPTKGASSEESDLLAAALLRCGFTCDVTHGSHVLCHRANSLRRLLNLPRRPGAAHAQAFVSHLTQASRRASAAASSAAAAAAAATTASQSLGSTSTGNPHGGDGDVSRPPMLDDGAAMGEALTRCLYHLLCAVPRPRRHGQSPGSEEAEEAAATQAFRDKLDRLGFRLAVRHASSSAPLSMSSGLRGGGAVFTNSSYHYRNGMTQWLTWPSSSSTHVVALADDRGKSDALWACCRRAGVVFLARGCLDHQHQHHRARGGGGVGLVAMAARLRRALGIITLSSSAFAVTLEPRGAARAMPTATRRLRGVLCLLRREFGLELQPARRASRGRGSGNSSTSNTLADSIQLVRHAGLTRRLVVPTPSSASAGSTDTLSSSSSSPAAKKRRKTSKKKKKKTTTTTTTTDAALHREEESLYAAFDMSGTDRLVVRVVGECEDFVVQLRDALQQRLVRVSISAAAASQGQANNAKEAKARGSTTTMSAALNLLTHLDADRRFAKFLSRDFGTSLPALLGDLHDLHGTTQGKDGNGAEASPTPTRRMHVGGEAEVPPVEGSGRGVGGTSTGGGAAAAAVGGRGRGRGLGQTVPAWMKSMVDKEKGTVPPAENGTAATITTTSSDKDDKTSPSVHGRGIGGSAEEDHASATRPTTVTGGRGRGLALTVPAWAAGDEASKRTIQAFKAKAEEKAMAAEEEEEEEAQPEAGPSDMNGGKKRKRDDAEAASAAARTAADAFLANMNVEKTAPSTSTALATTGSRKEEESLVVVPSGLPPLPSQTATRREQQSKKRGREQDGKEEEEEGEVAEDAAASTQDKKRARLSLLPASTYDTAELPIVVAAAATATAGLGGAAADGGGGGGGGGSVSEPLEVELLVGDSAARAARATFLAVGSGRAWRATVEGSILSSSSARLDDGNAAAAGDDGGNRQLLQPGQRMTVRFVLPAEQPPPPSQQRGGSGRRRAA